MEQTFEQRRRKEKPRYEFAGDGIYRRGATWWLDFRYDGRRHAVKLGKGITRTVAREIAGVKKGAILRGEAGIGKKRKDIGFDKAAEEFLTWAKANKRPKTIRCYSQCVRQLKRSFAGKRLSEINPFLIEKHKKIRIDEDARVAINREIATLKALFNRAIEWGKFEGLNPARSVKQLKEPAGRLRYLEPDEEKRLLYAAGEPLRTIILTGIYAGLRIQAEALTLRRKDVELRRGLLTVQAAYAKSGKTRTVPLARPLADALASLIEHGSGEYVFVRRNGEPYRSIRKAFDNACRDAKLTDVSPHVLRHTFASRLAMAGVDLRTIQELGGWSQLSMVQRYAHLSPSHKAEAIEKIASGFTTLFTTPEKGAASSAA